MDPVFFAIFAVFKIGSKVVSFCIANKFGYFVFTFFV